MTISSRRWERVPMRAPERRSRTLRYETLSLFSQPHVLYVEGGHDHLHRKQQNSNRSGVSVVSRCQLPVRVKIERGARETRSTTGQDEDDVESVQGGDYSQHPENHVQGHQVRPLD